MSVTKIINGRVITPYRMMDGAAVLIEDGLIKEVSVAAAGADADETIDAGGKYVMPGFIDIHSHGAGGHDFMDGDPDSFKIIAATHAKYGTTMIFPTLTSSKFDVLKESIKNFDAIEFD
ncbi:MAG: amidohydrolase family protein [Clostridia bacterium]|nr:amidohydrolase family protein [Clostridia bacterium]